MAAVNARVAAILQRADALLNSGDNEGAYQAYTEALILDPQNAGALNARGVAYLRLRLFNMADADFNRALLANPNFTDARENLQRSQQIQAQDSQRLQQEIQQADARERENRRQALAILGAAVNTSLPPPQSPSAPVQSAPSVVASTPQQPTFAPGGAPPSTVNASRQNAASCISIRDITNPRDTRHFMNSCTYRVQIIVRSASGSTDADRVNPGSGSRVFRTSEGWELVEAYDAGPVPNGPQRSAQ